MAEEKSPKFRSGSKEMSDPEIEMGKELIDIANHFSGELVQLSASLVEDIVKERATKIQAYREKLKENKDLLDLKASIDLDLQKSYSPEQEEANFNENLDAIYLILNSITDKIALRNPQMKDINDNIQEQIALLDDLVTAKIEGTITKDEYLKAFKEKLVTGKGFMKFLAYYERLCEADSTDENIEEMALCEQYLRTITLFIDIFVEKYQMY